MCESEHGYGAARVCDLISNKKIIAICRSIYGGELVALAGALLRGGVGLIEVTFDQADGDNLRKTSEAISMLSASFPEMAVGAGTVVRPEQLDAATTAGASFIVSPNVDSFIIAQTKRKGLVSIPGAMTPTEIVLAQRAGADFVKLFPSGQLGTAYIKAVMAPLNDAKLIATGGISADNLDSFLALGMTGAGIGGELCDKTLICGGRFDRIEEIARILTDIAKRYSAGTLQKSWAQD